VVDPSSIEVNRRQRRAKTDRLDVKKLLQMLTRYRLHGETAVWKVVHVPTEEQEDELRLHRERERLKKERTAQITCIRPLLALHGIHIDKLPTGALNTLQDWRGRPLPAGLLAELERELERFALLQAQLAAVEKQQAARLEDPRTVADVKAAKLSQLRGMGMTSAWILAKEFFGWRNFRNRRQVGALSGLTGTPYASGGIARDQGISKTGNKRVRAMMLELAWSWLRFQPRSELPKWFELRFGHGGKRLRRTGIVALTRKLLVALWKYVDKDELPAGQILLTAD